MSTKVRTPDAPETEEDQSNQGLLSASGDLITAIQAGDAKGVAAAIQAAFGILDSQPHEEYDPSQDESEEIT